MSDFHWNQSVRILEQHPAPITFWGREGKIVSVLENEVYTVDFSGVETLTISGKYLEWIKPEPKENKV